MFDWGKRVPLKANVASQANDRPWFLSMVSIIDGTDRRSSSANFARSCR